ncbi:MAG: hypothetical protein K2Z81_24925, partial [Cyanobacteria bacterium]|nr:hypothetical protein [Cyanobacteriota bacterium]
YFSRKRNKSIYMLLLASCVAITSCGGGEKSTNDASTNTTQEQVESSGTSATAGDSSDEGSDLDKEDQATVDIESNPSGVQVKAPGVRINAEGVHGEGDADVNVDVPGVQVRSGSAAGNTRVRLPGIKVDTDGNKENVDIDVPFVHVKKDGTGRVQVKTPFVNIDAKED